MHLNKLKPAAGSKKSRIRVGRGIGCGKGKTCGHGHKGQKARSGFRRKVGFEGGQFPLQRRLPKFGFKSGISRKIAEVRLNELNKVNAKKIDIEALKKANIINSKIKRVKVILSGEIKKPVVLSGLKVTKGAKIAIEKAGGKVEE